MPTNKISSNKIDRINIDFSLPNSSMEILHGVVHLNNNMVGVSGSNAALISFVPKELDSVLPAGDSTVMPSNPLTRKQ